MNKPTPNQAIRKQKKRRRKRMREEGTLFSILVKFETTLDAYWTDIKEEARFMWERAKYYARTKK